MGSKWTARHRYLKFGTKALLVLILCLLFQIFTFLDFPDLYPFLVFFYIIFVIFILCLLVYILENCGRFLFAGRLHLCFIFNSTIRSLSSSKVYFKIVPLAF